jgi:hypothetical protein
MTKTLHIVSVSTRTRSYPDMDDPIDSVKNHIVHAENEEEAEKKIRAHYERKSDPYGSSVAVTGVEFFEHIN